MLYTNIKNYIKALKGLEKNPIICSCGKQMKPSSRNCTMFGEKSTTWHWLRMVCECGNFLKSDIPRIPTAYHKKLGYKRQN